LINITLELTDVYELKNWW